MSIHSSLRYLLLLASIATLTAQVSPTQSLRGLIITSSKPDRANVAADRHPYFALMNEDGLCGAVLISKRFVLTAAHCIGADDDFEIGITEKVSDWASLFLESDSGGEEYPYSRVLRHPDYDSDTVDSDIALFELAFDVPDSIPYIRLENDPITLKGTPMTVVGFGDTDPSEFITETSDNLLQTTVDYVPTLECTARMIAAGGYDPINPSMLCAYEEGEDTCGGDSGGPLFLQGNTTEEDSLVGLVSWGYECGGDTPGVYTRISYFYDWIVESMCLMNAAGVPDYVNCTDIVGSGSGGSDVSMPPVTDTTPPSSTLSPTSPSTSGDDWWGDDWLSWLNDNIDDNFDENFDDDSWFDSDFLSDVYDTVEGWLDSVWGS
mmetsp:Transcript_806/g.1847  ORF Transcript_806/g.1847 Transcript_806/m.1847 type:complete len:377 (-) Transcript_806:150-1280(-)